MPTATKLFSAVFFAALAGLFTHLYIAVLPEGSQTARFREVGALIGLLCGWWIMGKSVGRGATEAINRGVVTAVSVLFWCLLILSIYMMIRKSTRMMYDGPMDAVVGILEMMLDYGALLQHPLAPGVLLVGGGLGGLLADAIGRRWS